MPPHFAVPDRRPRRQYHLSGLMLAVAALAIVLGTLRMIALGELLRTVASLALLAVGGLLVLAGVAALFGFAMALGYLGFGIAWVAGRMATRIRRAMR